MATATLFQTLKIDLEDYLNRSEVGDAELFARLFTGQILYDHTEKAWYIWRGAYWEADKTGEVFAKLDICAAEYLAAASDARAKGNKDLSEKFAKRANLLLTNVRMKSILDIASRLPGLAFKGDLWDSGSMVLPVANGIINLTTGKLYNSEPDDYIRTFCPVDWLGLDTPAPMWEKTLQDIFNNDPELIAFIGRVFGYGITGETKEQKLPIFWGSGANGKSTLMDVIMDVLGSGFCFNTQSESLMELRQGDSNGAKPFVMALRGKRLVFASESKEGQKLNVGLVKQLTGDGNITARTLHKEPVTFKQTHKIVLITNDCPNIPNSDDYAIWRRVLRVPFSICFKDNPTLPEERPLDKDLAQKLKAEYPGILAWLVRGCLDWQKQGLNPPDIVNKSTEDYRESEDLTLQFIIECLRKDPNEYIGAGFLYQTFTEWCESAGAKPISNGKFSEKIGKLFGKSTTYRPKGQNTGKPIKVYKGITWI